MDCMESLNQKGCRVLPMTSVKWIVFSALSLSVSLFAQDFIGEPSSEALEALGPELAALVQNAEEIRVFSIRPVKEERGARVGKYPILKERVLKSGSEMRRVRNGFYQSGTYGKQTADCFVPRHAVQLQAGGQEVRLLICFTCFQIRRVDNGVRIQIKSIGPLREILDSLLKRSEKRG